MKFPYSEIQSAIFTNETSLKLAMQDGSTAEFFSGDMAELKEFLINKGQ